jgi:hypothetical protein
MSNGLCLFDRNEKKFECSLKTANALKEKLLKTNKFVIEKVNGFSSQRINTMVFLDSNKVEFKNYKRPRIRGYYQNNLSEIDTLWLEIRQKNDNKVVKTRRSLYELSLPNEIHKLKMLGFFPKFFIDYKRTALDDSINNVRITFDEDICYYGLNQFKNRFKFGSLLGKEKIVIIKFKYLNDFSEKFVKKFSKNLKKPRSKLKQAIKYSKQKEMMA